MIHGDCVSVGCYAMTDSGIDEIFQFVTGALVFGQPSVQVSIYPFRMTNATWNATNTPTTRISGNSSSLAMIFPADPQTAGRISDRRPLCGEQAAQPRGCPAAAGLNYTLPETK
ncbi:transpeptidase [Klebsiella pneumoniae]|uniref:Transpeptidase n=1 Tax=Klebsiella pneumoniae TaxID=573 RepID=A0A377ZIH8_KLEPN|nr:transpeptidase [Klebsiella pneumoniae]